MAWSALGRSQPWLASTRSETSDPTASRSRRTLSTSWATGCAAVLILKMRWPSATFARASATSALHGGPPRHAASPQPVRPSAVWTRTKAKLTASRVVKDILCGRFTGMSARVTRTSAIFTGSLGVGGRFGNGARAGEPTRIEEREIERRLAVEQPFRHVAAGGRRMLKPMATEPDRQEEALDARRPPDDGVVVRRERSEAGPAAGDTRVADDRQTLDRLLHRLLHFAPVHRHVEVLADVLDVSRAQQHLLHLLPEVEAAGDVGRQRHGTGDRREWLGEEDVPASGMHGQLHPRQPRNARGGGPGGVDHQRRSDRSGRGHHPADPALRPLERRDAHALRDLHAPLARAPGEARGGLGGPRGTGSRPPHPGAAGGPPEGPRE